MDIICCSQVPYAGIYIYSECVTGVCFSLLTVSREDSSQSLASCLNLPPSPMDASGDRILGKDISQR